MMESLQHLDWRQPVWWWLALCPWLIWAVQGLQARARGRDYADPALLPWAGASVAQRLDPRLLWRHACIALAWLLFALALAGPRLAQSVHDRDGERYNELMVVLDVSLSMSAHDVNPGRLERARLELEDLIRREEGLRIGLVVYAAKPHLLMPPTFDKAVLRHGLRVVRQGLLPTEGSDLSAAIEFAAARFSDGARARALLLVTDGEISADGAVADASLREVVTRLAQQGVQTYALGVGSVQGAPLHGPAGGWLQHEGRAVISALQEQRLRRLADAGNGRYARVADTDADWHQIYDQSLHRWQVDAVAEEGEGLIEWRELFAWCLLPGIVLLLLAQARVPTVRSAPVLLGPMLLLTVSLNPVPAQADSLSLQAWEAYGRQDFEEARQTYARVGGYEGRIGEGASAYRLEDYRLAIQLFTQAILDAGDDERRARAMFNLANSHYRLAEYGEAAELYRETLRYAPGDGAALRNLELALAMQARQQAEDDTPLTTREGRGHRTARAAEGTEIVHGSLSIDEGQEAGEPIAGRVPPVPFDIVEQGFDQARAVDEQAGAFSDPQWRYAETTDDRIVLRARSLRVDEAVFWKRLFELEEGIVAPLDSPREQPGMRPW